MGVRGSRFRAWSLGYRASDVLSNAEGSGCRGNTLTYQQEGKELLLDD